jgi:hypothetical protein
MGRMVNRRNGGHRHCEHKFTWLRTTLGKHGAGVKSRWQLLGHAANLPLLSISGAAREVPPRETSTKGRRLRKELESSLDGDYWAMTSAAWR